MPRIGLIGLLLAAACAAPQAAPAGWARVVKVVDGDTIWVEAGGSRTTVRLIGVDTPETRRPGRGVECFGRRASAFLTDLVAGREVRLVYDVDRLDRYGRALAYVFRARDGLFVNREIIARGYGTVLTVPPNVSRAPVFLAAQREARATKRGLWRACAIDAMEGGGGARR